VNYTSRKRYSRIRGVFALLLCTAVIAAVCPAYAAFADQSGDASIYRTGAPGETIRFSSEDFTAALNEGEVLDGILIAALPDSSAGTLTCGGRALLEGEAVTVENLSNLCFVPAGESETTASFNYLPVFSSGVGSLSRGAVETIRIINHAPTAENITCDTIKNIAVTCRFKGGDADGDALIFRIEKAPSKGDVAISGDDPSSFVYTPYKNKVGKDSFTYIAIDPDGKESEPATVSIQICKNAAKMTYSDMDGNSSHYAAIKLAEEGILIGERIGEKYFFYPETKMTRGEFIAMAVTCLGLDVLSPVSETGFSDDDTMQSWLKPYVATALKAGLISGITTASGVEFRSSAEITRAEAAVVVSNAIGKSSTVSAPVFADIEAVPAWADTAARTAVASGIIITDSSGALNPMQSITRAEAAQILCSLMLASEAGNTKGLLDSVFG